MNDLASGGRASLRDGARPPLLQAAAPLHSSPCSFPGVPLAAASAFLGRVFFSIPECCLLHRNYTGKASGTAEQGLG